jgi:hypothetical protein
MTQAASKKFPKKSFLRGYELYCPKPKAPQDVEDGLQLPFAKALSELTQGHAPAWLP